MSSYGKKSMKESQECPGFNCIKLENNSLKETPESPTGLLTQMSLSFPLGMKGE